MGTAHPGNAVAPTGNVLRIEKAMELSDLGEDVADGAVHQVGD
jgi:hypothetical protein